MRGIAESSGEIEFREDRYLGADLKLPKTIQSML